MKRNKLLPLFSYYNEIRFNGDRATIENDVYIINDYQYCINTSNRLWWYGKLIGNMNKFIGY